MTQQQQPGPNGEPHPGQQQLYPQPPKKSLLLPEMTQAAAASDTIQSFGAAARRRGRDCPGGREPRVPRVGRDRC